MKIIDLMNWLGKRRWLKPLAQLMLLVATNISFPLLLKISGRRVVSASAGAPAVVQTNSTVKAALKDPRLLFKAMKHTVENMGLDTMFLFVDMSLEAEACGCQVQFDDVNLPVVTSHPVKTIDDVAGLKVPDPYRDGRMPLFLETMRLMRNYFALLRVAEVIGPFTLATHLVGTDIYLDTRKNPEKVKAVLEYCLKVIIRYAQALTKSGAHWILIAEPNGSQLSPSAYEEFSLSFTKRIVNALDRPCVLHICGRAGHIIDKMCQSGAVALSIDDVDLAQAIKNVPRGIVIIGNISPLKFSRSSPAEIESETLKLLETVKTRQEFLVAPGCDLSPQTPLDNILSFVNTVRQYRNK